jgi:hypothetical protein
MAPIRPLKEAQFNPFPARTGFRAIARRLASVLHPLPEIQGKMPIFQVAGAAVLRHIARETQMHYLHSAKSLLAFRLGILGLCLLGLDLLAILVVGPVGLILGDPKLLRWTLFGLLALPVTGLFYLFFGWRARCPLCMNPVLVLRACQKHRNASTLAGSHRLRVATSALFAGRFTCPYCGERTRLVVRDRHHRQSSDQD